MTYIYNTNKITSEYKLNNNTMTRTQPKMRDLMPEKYGNTLRERTGRSRNHIYDVVNNERTDATIWPEVLKLADEYQKQLRQNVKKTLELKSNAA